MTQVQLHVLRRHKILTKQFVSISLEMVAHWHQNAATINTLAGSKLIFAVHHSSSFSFVFIQYFVIAGLWCVIASFLFICDKYITVNITFVLEMQFIVTDVIT